MSASYKMKARVVCFFLLLAVTSSDNIYCEKQCTCTFTTYGDIDIDCSNTTVQLREVCRFIGNISHHNVSILRFEFNSVEEITASDINGCGSLRELYIGGNNISAGGMQSFRILDKLELLDISNNSQTFDTYPNVTYLTNLRSLYMDGLPNQDFPDSYRKMEKLENVTLSGFKGKCNVSRLTNSTLKNLVHLRTLNVSLCDIERIDAGAFRSLSYLENLDLSYNYRLGFRNLRNVSYGLQYTNIKSLNYSNVHVTFGRGTWVQNSDICYLWNSTLKEIVLNSNRIEMMETNLAILFPLSLEIYRVEDNKFTFGPYLLQLGCVRNVREFYGNHQNAAHNPFLYEQEPLEGTTESIKDNECPFMRTEFLRNVSKPNKNCNFFEPNMKITIEPERKLPEKLEIFSFADCGMDYNLPAVPVLPWANNVTYMDISGNIFYSWIGPLGPFFNLTYLDLSRNYCSHVGLKFFNSFVNVENLQIQQNFIGLVLGDQQFNSETFSRLTEVKILNISSNIISIIPPSAFSKMSKLEILDLSVNNIDEWTIDVSAMDNLIDIRLRANSVNTLPSVLRMKLEDNSKRLGKSFSIDLRNNTFTIDCDGRDFLKWMVNHRKNMFAFEAYTFQDETQRKKLSADEFVHAVGDLDKKCGTYLTIIIIGTVFVSVFLSIVIGGFIYKNRWKLRYLMRMSKFRQFRYTKLQNDIGNDNYINNAFISYANENLRFVLDQIIPNLERNEMKLCIHDRDFLPGNNIADNILGAIRNSSKTVVILSEAFLRSKWCIYEFNMARMETIYSRDGSSCLVVVMLEDVATRDMSNEMLDWIQSNTYLEYTTDTEGEELFWNNLNDALQN